MDHKITVGGGGTGAGVNLSPWKILKDEVEDLCKFFSLEFFSNCVQKCHVAFHDSYLLQVYKAIALFLTIESFL